MQKIAMNDICFPKYALMAALDLIKIKLRHSLQ